MGERKKLTYFRLPDLLDPLDAKIAELDKICLDGSYYGKDYLVKGIFAYTVALFESALADYLRAYYLGFPEKFTLEFKNDAKVDVRSMNYTFSYEIFEVIVDDQLRLCSYESQMDTLRRIQNTFPGSGTLQFHSKNLIEYKERRNLLIHNNLKIDKYYIEKVKCSPDLLGEYLTITGDYIADVMLELRAILAQIRESAAAYFASYTNERLIRDVWDYFFSALPFEQYFRYWNGKLQFYPLDALQQRKGTLSGSEKTLLAYFILNHSPDHSGIYFELKDLKMQVSVLKMKELVVLFDKYPLLLQDF